MIGIAIFSLDESNSNVPKLTSASIKGIFSEI